MSNNDLEIILFCLEQEYERVVAKYQRGGLGLPQKPYPSEEFSKFVGRLETLIRRMRRAGY